MLTTFEVSFEAVCAVLEIDLSLKSNHQIKFSLSKSLIHTVDSYNWKDRQKKGKICKQKFEDDVRKKIENNKEKGIVYVTWSVAAKKFCWYFLREKQNKEKHGRY